MIAINFNSIPAKEIGGAISPAVNFAALFYATKWLEIIIGISRKNSQGIAQFIVYLSCKFQFI